MLDSVIEFVEILKADGWAVTRVTPGYMALKRDGFEMEEYLYGEDSMHGFRLIDPSGIVLLTSSVPSDNKGRQRLIKLIKQKINPTKNEDRDSLRRPKGRRA